MRTGVLILGPRTRLGRTLYDSSWAGRREVLIVARERDEVGALAAEFPRATVVPAWDPTWNLPTGFEAVTVCACAVGVIHPEGPRWTRDVEAAVRDLGVIERAVRTAGTARVHIVFVSSVLALATPAPRSLYYSGWKRLLEASIAALADGKATLSVLFPGRLVARRAFARPMTLLHSTYAAVAGRIERLAEAGRPRRVLHGLDARLWLLVRSLKTGLDSFRLR